MKIAQHKTPAGFTLVEMMMGLGCGSILLAALLAASVCLQRSFTAIEAYSVAEGDQLRVQDYIAIDCRRATETLIDHGSWTNSGGTWAWVSNAAGAQTLMITVPAYYDSSSKNPVAPFFDAYGRALYGSGGVAASVTISYYKSGTDFVRQVGNDPTAAKPFGITKIATDVASFTVTPVDQSTVSGTVTCSITFSPRFQNLNPRVDGTTIYCSTFLRNAQARN